ncbi:MAG: glycosyltransferase family 39 protein [Patescibacteria group bacterium]
MKRLLAAAVAVFALTASILAFVNASGAPWRFDWPDETSTAYFARRIAAGESVTAEDPDIALLERRLHPRSVNVRDGMLVPAGFVGLPILLGTVGRVFGNTASLFVVPLLAAASGFGLYVALRSVLSQRHAVLSAVLFLFHPATWYFAAFTHLPNIPFLALLILSAAGMALARSQKKHAVPLFALSGAAAGLAFGIRLSEALWAVPVLLVLLAATSFGSPVSRRVAGGVRWRQAAAWFLGLSLAIAPTLLLQQVLFGSLLAGYARFSEAGIALPSESVGGVLAYIFPFGIHPLRAAARFWDSFLAPFWWYAIPAVVGVILAGYAAWGDASRQRRMFARGALVIAGLVCGYLVLLYGSWQFADPLMLAVNTVGRSYVRYWLPIALAMSIAAAGALERLEGFPELRVRIVGRVLLAGMIVASFSLVFVTANESLQQTYYRTREYRRMAAAVEAIVPPDGIILTQRLDKAFFPERRVIALEGPLWEDQQAIDLVARYGTAYHFYYIDDLHDDGRIAARSVFVKFGVDATVRTYLRGESIPVYELTVRK